MVTRIKTRAKKISRKTVKARRVSRKKAPGKPGTVKVNISKCEKCKVPLSGLGYKLIARPLFGIKPSTKKKGHCNKCE